MSEPEGRAAEFTHRPVLVDEVVRLLGEVPDGLLVDATVGGGGHSAALLEAHPGLQLLGLDRDPDALAAAAEQLAGFGSRIHLVHTRFDHLEDAMATIDPRPLTAVLFDLGVSSPQLDRPERGFSYRHEGPLDMRMDPTTPTRAADLVNESDEADLAQLLAHLGDERHARRIARAIVAARPIGTTTELAEIVRDAIPAAARRRGGHPATRTFQALRMAVNDELPALERAVDIALERLARRGRCAALTYHSGEDRIVKRRFAAACRGAEVPRGLPVRETPSGAFRNLTRRPVRASEDEVADNPRARSVRLRAVERRDQERAQR